MRGGGCRKALVKRGGGGPFEKDATGILQDAVRQCVPCVFCRVAKRSRVYLSEMYQFIGFRKSTPPQNR